MCDAGDRIAGQSGGDRMTDTRSLIRGIAQGDEAAFAQLYDETSRLVYGLVLRIVREPATAEEVSLEVYMQVWRTAATYDTERGSVTAWLATAARSRALDWMRSKQARLYRDGQGMEDLPELMDVRVNPEQSLAQTQQATFVRQAMNALPSEQRIALDLGFYSGLTHSEIAERLNLPLGTVKSRIRMGMTKLREMLGPLQEAAGL
jgi:RNA polymerase sigma-70 factor (ECF subfamily)